MWPKNRSEAQANAKRKRVRRGKDRTSTRAYLSVRGFVKTSKDPRQRVAGNSDLRAIRRGETD